MAENQIVVEALHRVVLNLVERLATACSPLENRGREAKPRRADRAALPPKSLLSMGQTLHVIAVSLSHIRGACICTERDVMYTAPVLFGKDQRCAARTIQRVCRMMAAAAAAVGHADHSLTYTRESLHIVACAKSLLIGYIQFTYRNNENGTWNVAYCDGMSTPTGVGHVITPSMALSAHGFTHCKRSGATTIERSSGGRPFTKLLIVLVEKEATLQHLVHSENALTHLPVVFVCTRGYPCVASRTLLRRLLHDRPQPSRTIIFALTDGDPHGLRIALTWMGIHGQRVPNTITRDGNSTAGKSDGDVNSTIAVRWVGIAPRRVDPAQRIPFTHSDEQLLKSVISTLEEHLAAATQSQHSSGIHSGVIESLQRLRHEALLMQQSQVKCELQAAAHGLLPLLQEAVWELRNTLVEEYP